jgi:hypothetical protein
MWGEKPPRPAFDWLKPVGTAVVVGLLAWSGGKIDSLVLWQQRIQTAFDALCGRVETTEVEVKQLREELQRVQLLLRAGGR